MQDLQTINTQIKFEGKNSLRFKRNYAKFEVSRPVSIVSHYFGVYMKSLAQKLTEKLCFRKIHVCEHL